MQVAMATGFNKSFDNKTTMLFTDEPNTFRTPISLKRFVELYSTNPARIIGLSRKIAEKQPANLTIFDPNREFNVRASEFKSKSRNTPFDGWTLRGSPMATIYKGKVVWKHETL